MHAFKNLAKHHLVSLLVLELKHPVLFLRRFFPLDLIRHRFIHLAARHHRDTFVMLSQVQKRRSRHDHNDTGKNLGYWESASR